MTAIFRGSKIPSEILRTPLKIALDNYSLPSEKNEFRNSADF